MVEDRVRAVTRETSLESLIQWSESLTEQQIDYLLEEAHHDASADQQAFSALDSRVVAIVGWAVIGVGTLLIAGDVDFDLSGRGITAISVVVGASIAVVAGLSLLWPRDWASGLDLEWYSQYNWNDAREMKARSLAILIHGSNLNRRTIALRNRLLQTSAVGLLIEFSALVATLSLSAGRA